MFESPDAFYAAAEKLAAELDGSLPAAAALIRGGVGKITGLTDGFADCLDDFETAQRDHGAAMTPEQRERLQEIRDAAYRATHRSSPPPRWLDWLDDWFRGLGRGR